jgi:hypothetical protein
MSWIIALMGAQLLGTVQADMLCPTCAMEPELDVAETATEEQEELEAELEIGGALRFNLQYKDWFRQDFELPRVGDFEFDTFRLNADGSYGDLLFSAEYRIYAGYHMLHHGWVGYEFSDAFALRAGVHKIPFGPLPYASHNWFFQLPYYVGLEDDYDAGVKAIYASGPWNAQAAFYKNDEGTYTGSSLASARYSYDVVPTTVDELGYAGLTEARFNEEVNQFNGRITYDWGFAEEGRAEFGLSGQWGQLYNARTDRFGSHWASSVHVDATYDRWNLIAEAIRYEAHPENPGGVDRRFVVMGAYDAPYKVASKASLYLAGLAYTIPVEWGPVSAIQFYDDYTYMAKSEFGYEATQQNVLGSALSAGPLYVYIDLASGRNHPWLGPDYGVALAEGGEENEWHTRFNINIGYYF